MILLRDRARDAHHYGGIVPMETERKGWMARIKECFASAGRRRSRGNWTGAGNGCLLPLRCKTASKCAASSKGKTMQTSELIARLEAANEMQDYQPSETERAIARAMHLLAKALRARNEGEG